MKKYNVGDKVWLATHEVKQVTKSCPVCFGNKEITLVLGNGDLVILPCDYCGHGGREPSGTIVEHEYVAKPEHAIITRVSTETDAYKEVRRYYFGARFADCADIFGSKKEALTKCVEKATERNREEMELARHIKESRYKSFSWNAGYHLRAANEHRRKVEYHERNAKLCKLRQKVGD